MESREMLNKTVIILNEMSEEFVYSALDNGAQKNYK